MTLVRRVTMVVEDPMGTEALYQTAKYSLEDIFYIENISEPYEYDEEFEYVYAS